jgi:hypothetical protein
MAKQAVKHRIRLRINAVPVSADASLQANAVDTPGIIQYSFKNVWDRTAYVQEGIPWPP